MDPQELRELSRDELVERAESLEVSRPQALPTADLIDEIIKRSAPADRVTRLRGWLGRARDLVSRIIERGLHLPQAVKLMRGETSSRSLPEPPPPLPTVTLAEIYAAQGHVVKALSVLDQVLAREPDSRAAQALRDKLAKPRAARARKARSADSVDKTATGAAPGQVPEPAAEPAEDAEARPKGAPIDADAVAREKGAPNEPDAMASWQVGQVTFAQDSAGPPPSAEQDLVALATDPHTAYVYWELRPKRFARVRWADPSGRLVLRVVTVTPTNGDTETQSWDLDVDALSGDLFVRELPAGSELRLCLAWRGDRGFVPLAIAPEMQMPHTNPSEIPPPAYAEWQPPEPAPSLAHEICAATRAQPPSEALVHAAGSRLRSYLDQLSAAPRLVPTVRFGADYPRYLMQPWRIRTKAGGASELHGGASELYGGASELYGGASELSIEAEEPGGASELSD